MQRYKTNQVFDKAFKRIIRLSNTSVINFINGLFGKDFPLDSKVTYCSTETVKSDLKKIVSDCIIAINGIRFLIELQINNDSRMVIRVFEYSYEDALLHSEVYDNTTKLNFAYPKIIYLEPNNSTEDKYFLEFCFEHQKSFKFEVPTLKLLDLTVKDLSKNKMVVLLPLYLLKFRKEIKKNPSKDNQLKLKNLIKNELIPAIFENCKLGIISNQDRIILLELIQRLFNEIYGGIKMLDHAYITEDLEEELRLDCDDILEELNSYKNLFEEVKKQAEETHKQAEKIKRQIQKAQNQAKQANKQAEEANKENEENKNIFAKELLKLGVSPEKIMLKFKLTNEKITTLLKELENEEQ